MVTDLVVCIRLGCLVTLLSSGCAGVTKLFVNVIVVCAFSEDPG